LTHSEIFVVVLRDDILGFGLIQAESAVLLLEQVSLGLKEVPQKLGFLHTFFYFRQNAPLK